MVDFLIATGVTAVAATGIFSRYIYRKAKKQIYVDEEYSSFDEILNAIKLYIVDETKEVSSTIPLTDAEYRRLKKLRALTRTALKNAPNGVREAKLYVKGMIGAWVVNNLSEDKVREILGLDESGEPDHNTMFEILMFKYRKMTESMPGKKRDDAFSIWFEKNGFNKPKPGIGIVGPKSKSYYVTKKEFEESYYNENFTLTREEVYEIFTTKIYESYMGWGAIDTLAEMNINGYNIGVSGSLLNTVDNTNTQDPDAVSTPTNSFWVYYDSAYIHLQFIDFGTIEEIRRIEQLLIRFNSPGPLTAKKGAKVNTMYDKSRILVVRPDAGETWGAFVRKFSTDIKSPEELIVKKGVTNGEICTNFIRWLINGKLTIAVTGRQGSGKTTNMKAFMGYMPTDWNIRVLEMAPELYLRETYPYREIYSAQETDFITMEALQDFFKKADATVTVIGEVATDAVAARMIQLAMTGSEMTIFTHHAKTAKDLILTIRNSLVNACGFSNMQTAEKQVTDVLKVNIDLGFEDGKRFIRRITEIRQLDEGIPYPDYDPTNPERSLYNLNKEYYYRQTDRISFTTHDLLYYDKTTDTYKIGEKMSESLYEKIVSSLPMELQQDFKDFYAYYWEGKEVENYSGIGEYTGEKEEMVKPDEEVLTYDDALDFLHERYKLI